MTDWTLKDQLEMNQKEKPPMAFELFIEYPEGTPKAALEEHIKRAETGAVKAMTWLSKAARRLGAKVKLGALESRIENNAVVFKVQAPDLVPEELLMKKLGNAVVPVEKMGVKVTWKKISDLDL